MDQWANKICNGDYEGQIFSTTVNANVKPWWIVSMIILTSVVASDCLEHLKFMKIASPLHKILLTIQILVSINISFLNALLAAA